MKTRQLKTGLRGMTASRKLALLGLAIWTWHTTAGTAAIAAERPISDFVSRQGTYIVSVDEDGNITGGEYDTDSDRPGGLFAWWDAASDIGLIIDYPGIDARWLKRFCGIDLGTTCEGSISETPLPDGRAEVAVVLQTRHVLVWATQGWDFVYGPMIFGYRWPELAEGVDVALAALGDSLFQVRFVNTAPNAPLPDLIQLLVLPEPGQELLSNYVSARATGPMRAASGYEEGTLALLHTAQQNWMPAVAARASFNSMLNRYGASGLPGKIFIQPVGNKDY